MRNKISGVIGILWGSGILVNYFMNQSNSNHATSAYQTGYQTGTYTAVAIGSVLLLAGLYYLFKKK